MKNKFEEVKEENERLAKAFAMGAEAAIEGEKLKDSAANLGERVKEDAAKAEAEAKIKAREDLEELGEKVRARSQENAEKLRVEAENLGNKAVGKIDEITHNYLAGFSATDLAVLKITCCAAGFVTALNVPEKHKKVARIIGLTALSTGLALLADAFIKREAADVHEHFEGKKSCPFCHFLRDKKDETLENRF